MKDYRSNVAFIDLLFNLLVCFVALFIIAFLLIQPPTNPGKINPPAEVYIKVEWDKEQKSDVDLWVRGPDGQKIGYRMKDAGYMVLNRDDTGASNDSIVVDGKPIIIKNNSEVAEIRLKKDGTYVVNVNLFRKYHSESTVPVTVTLTNLKPYDEVYSRDVTLLVTKHEETVFTFKINKAGDIVEIDTTAKVELAGNDYHY